MTAEPHSAHILVVDDDPKIRQLLRRCFEPEGFRVSEATTQDEVLTVVRAENVDLITLDLHLGGEDGLSIARAVRNIAAVPIVMVTGKGDVIDRVVGLELGADDYITKPFHLRELLARIRSVLRRTGGTQPAPPAAAAADRELHRFGDWAADFEALEIRHAGKTRTDFTTSDIRLLEAFLTRPNRVLSRDQLMDLVKGHDWNPSDRSIDNQVARLRKKIEADPKTPRFLKTVRGAGYVFTPSGGEE